MRRTQLSRAPQVLAASRIAFDIDAMCGHHDGVHFLSRQFGEILAQDTEGEMLERVPAPALITGAKDNHAAHFGKEFQLINDVNIFIISFCGLIIGEEDH